MHNIPFQASDHVTKLSSLHVPRFGGCPDVNNGTKTAIIINEALGQHYVEKTLTDMLKFLSDKTDKYCVILIAFLIQMKVMSVQYSLTYLLSILARLIIFSEIT